jgi:hypothetical protein
MKNIHRHFADLLFPMLLAGALTLIWWGALYALTAAS